MERPDLSNISPEVMAYIEYLERRLRISSAAPVEPAEPKISEAALPPESPTTLSVVTVSCAGIAKRTRRHLYPRQHRAGMGIFDLDVADPDYPVALGEAAENQGLLIFTSKARVFRHPGSKISDVPVHSKGEDLFERAPLDPDESVAAVLPERASGYVAILSAQGRVRSLRHHLFGEHMRPGTSLYRYEEFGSLVSACWTPGDAELLLLTRNGQGIRFSEKLINPQGDWGIRLSGDDRAVAVTSIFSDSQVFMIGAGGKGILRQMSGFAPNKSLGGSGKIAMKTDQLVGAVTVDPDDDLFVISRLGKIIRFPVEEVSVTEGVVQGVTCMSLRGDEVSAVLKSSLSAQSSMFS